MYDGPCLMVEYAIEKMKVGQVLINKVGEWTNTHQVKNIEPKQQQCCMIVIIWL